MHDSSRLGGLCLIYCSCTGVRKRWINGDLFLRMLYGLLEYYMAKQKRISKFVLNRKMLELSGARRKIVASN